MKNYSSISNLFKPNKKSEALVYLGPSKNKSTFCHFRIDCDFAMPFNDC